MRPIRNSYPESVPPTILSESTMRSPRRDRSNRKNCERRVVVAALLGYTGGAFLAKVYPHIDQDADHLKKALVDRGRFSRRPVCCPGHPILWIQQLWDEYSFRRRLRFICPATIGPVNL